MGLDEKGDTFWFSVIWNILSQGTEQVYCTTVGLGGLWERFRLRDGNTARLTDASRMAAIYRHTSYVRSG